MKRVGNGRITRGPLRHYRAARLVRKKAHQILKSHTRGFLSSLSVKEKKARSTQAAREHWSIENRNLHKRDASAWQEERHKHRRPKAALNLALKRNARLAIIPFKQGDPLNLILNSRPVL